MKLDKFYNSDFALILIQKIINNLKQSFKAIHKNEPFYEYGRKQPFSKSSSGEGCDSDWRIATDAASEIESIIDAKIPVINGQNGKQD